LVILDVMMPGMSGWEVCRKIREAVSLAHTGVIMLTGIGENLNEMTSPLYGADTYLDKPFEFSLLDDKLKETLAARRQGAMGRPDPDLAVLKSSRPPPPPKANGIAGAPKKAAAPKTEKKPAKAASPAKPLVKAAPRKAAPEPKKAKAAAPAPKKAKAKKAAPKKAAKAKAAPKKAVKAKAAKKA